MQLARKWLTTVVVALGLLAGIGNAIATEMATASATAPADPATWGVYARLIETEWNGEPGQVHWRWGSDNTIVESRTFQMKSVIRPGANRGELVSVYGPGLHTYDGRIAADGSVLWVRRGRFLKMPSRVSIVEGRFVEEMVKLDDAGQVAKVGTILRFDQIAGAKIDAVAATPETATSSELVARNVSLPAVVETTRVPPEVMPVAVAAPVAPASVAAAAASVAQSAPLSPPSPALFGPYAQLVGFSHMMPEGRQIRWYQASDTTIVHEIRAAAGEIESLQVIKATGAGTVVMLRSGWCPDGVCGQAGTIEDGVVHWKEPKASGGHSGGFMDTRVWVENGAFVSHATDPSPSAIEFFEQHPQLKHGPVRLPLVPTPPLTAEQVAESTNRVSQLEPLVEVEVAKAISKQLATGQSIADAQAARQRSAERVRSFNRLMGSVNGVLTEANDVATANEARSRAELDATLAQINAQADVQRRAQAQAPSGQSRPGVVDQQRSEQRATGTNTSGALTVESVASSPGVAPGVSAPRADAGQEYMYCALLKPGSFEGHNGARFFSAIALVTIHKVQPASENFRADVQGAYGVNGPASCHFRKDRAALESFLQDELAVPAFRAHKTVMTGIQPRN